MTSFPPRDRGLDHAQETVIAARVFETGSGPLTLHILPTPDETPSMTYRFLDAAGDVVESLTTYGVDTVQALLFCLAAAGDRLRVLDPEASFAQTGVAGLPITELGDPVVWRAVVTMPAGEAPEG
ncbi:hypothetical protein NBM05_14040 [Rothia sp. AR01]|uniref:Uncharacterized protein n=1 Tax=Rothia santali TaxID=2949643 RepID=A0A9X2HFE3_9MICC|nr:hypothetical protein [Rothia santali]MCP3427100.1 hypothetical protein [Rothia santali]